MQLHSVYTNRNLALNRLTSAVPLWPYAYWENKLALALDMRIAARFHYKNG